MNYYHGSPEKFDKFDLSKSKSEFVKVIHLTPHKKYAIDFATKYSGSGYLYTVNVKDEDSNRQYHESMSNVSFAQTDNLEITNIEFVTKINKQD